MQFRPLPRSLQPTSAATNSDISVINVIKRSTESELALRSHADFRRFAPIARIMPSPSSNLVDGSGTRSTEISPFTLS